MSRPISASEKNKRIREAVVICISILFIIILTTAEVHLTRLSADAEMGSNIIIFGIINVVILFLVLLVYLVSRNVVKLFIENNAHPFATNLRTKLVLSFIGLSLVPTMLLFFAAAGFINNTIHNWFNNQIENSLSESLEVAQTYYKNSATNALYYGHQISGFIRQQRLLNEDNLPVLQELIRQKQVEYNLGVVEVFSAQREELVQASNPKVPRGEFTYPTSEDISKGLSGNELTRVNQAGKADLIRGIVPVYSTWNKRDVVGVVVVNYYVPYSLVSKMKEITRSYHEFRQLKILKNPIRTGYIITLFLITVVIIFFAYWMGVYLANSMTKPIHDLVQATHAVADGNLDVHIETYVNDEIGMLVQSFNRMTDDLRSKHLALNATHSELSLINHEIEQRRRYMEIVLQNVAAGVISVDREGVITTINTSAESLLRIRRDSVIGKNFHEILDASHLAIVSECMNDLSRGRQDTINRQIVLNVNGDKLTLHLHLTMLRDESGSFMGTVLVLDDMTQVLKVQRMAAWREVARRIAHEIKNPLTPIQLSAQRLRKRYLSSFDNGEKVFDECTDMIIKSVDELKGLVNEFSNFARMPAINPEPADLNSLIREVLALYQQAHHAVVFHFLADDSLPSLAIDRSQIKRVVINLLENAVAAMKESGTITITSHYDKELKMATFKVADDGPGINAEDRSRLFEPYFSTKSNGTGLGLAIVSSIISDHNGFVRIKDNIPKGACFVVELPAA